MQWKQMIINLTNEPFNDDQKTMCSLFSVRYEENANVSIIYVSIKDSIGILFSLKSIEASCP